MDIIDLPVDRGASRRDGFDFNRLSLVLGESADLLEQAQTSGDPEFKDAAIELAMRALRAAGMAIEQHVPAGRPAAHGVAGGRMISGPWAGAALTAGE